MSQAEQPKGTSVDEWGNDDVAGDDQESEDSQTDRSKPPTIEELKAAASAAAAAVSGMAGNHQPQTDNQNQHRAKKAQKTKGRVQINVPVNSNQDAQDQQPQQQPVGKRKQKYQPPPEPVDDDEEEDEEDEEPEEPSQILISIIGFFQSIGSFLVWILKGIGCLFKKLWNFGVGVVKFTWKLLGRVVPLLVGVPLYCLVLYLTAEYLATHFPSANQLDMSCRLNYVLRCHAFTMLPVLLGLVVSSQKSDGVHHRFYNESYEQAILLIVNTLIMAAHCNADQLHWVWCITVGYLAFSGPYWMSLVRGKPKLQATLRSPIFLTNTALMLYNIIILSGQQFGYFLPEGPTENESKESAGVEIGTQTSPDDYLDPQSSGYTWWYFLFPSGIMALFYQNQHLLF